MSTMRRSFDCMRIKLEIYPSHTGKQNKKHRFFRQNDGEDGAFLHIFLQIKKNIDFLLIVLYNVISVTFQINGGNMNSHYTKEEIVKDDFLFASYKSEEKDIVFDVLDFLIKEGVRVWYDADLVIGDKWPEVVKNLVNHENCRGIIFFNSVEAFKSEPIFFERRFASKRIAASKGTESPFVVFPVNIGQPSTMLILKSVFASLPQDPRGIEREFPLEYMEDIISLFSKDTIYCYADPENVDGYKKRLYDNIFKALPSVVDKTTMPPTAAGNAVGASILEIGVKAGAPTDKLPSYMLATDQRVSHKGEVFVVSGGVAYSTKRITWQQMYFDKEDIYFISRDIVDVRNGGAALNDWLKNEFLSFAFNEEERAKIKEVRLLKEKEMEKIKTPEFFVFSDGDGADSHWWIDSMNMGALQKVVKKTGTIYSSGYNFRTKKSGVRPVIRISRELI